MSDLTDRIRAKFPGAYDDLSDADLEKAILAKHPEYADLASKTLASSASAEKPGLLSSIGQMVASDPQVSGLLKIAGLVKDHPVAAGATIGSALATGGASIPAQVALGALGAGGGAAYGLLGKGAATGDYGSPTENAKTIAANAATGAIGEGLGQGAQALVKGGAKLVYKTALRPSMALQREFGDVAATGLKEGFPVSEGGAKAAEAAEGLSADQGRQLLAQAAPTAPPVRITTEVGKETQPIIQRAGLRAATGLPDESAGIVTRIKSMSKANPGGVDLARAQAMKGELQDLAARVYRAQDLGNPVTDLSADTNAAMARGLRKAIETRVPEMGPVNARTQDLMGARSALENATMRNVPGVGSLRSLLGDFMPAVSSTAAIGADRVAPALPLSLKAALIAALNGEQ